VSVPVEEADNQPRVGILLRDVFPELPVKVSIRPRTTSAAPRPG
jgi:hypothetical protein